MSGIGASALPYAVRGQGGPEHAFAACARRGRTSSLARAELTWHGLDMCRSDYFRTMVAAFFSVAVPGVSVFMLLTFVAPCSCFAIFLTAASSATAPREALQAAARLNAAMGDNLPAPGARQSLPKLSAPLHPQWGHWSARTHLLAPPRCVSPLPTGGTLLLPSVADGLRGRVRRGAQDSCCLESVRCRRFTMSFSRYP